MDAAFAMQLVTWLSAGEKAFEIATNVYNKISEIRARGRAPTQDELLAIAEDARAQFEALPAPE